MEYFIFILVICGAAYTLIVTGIVYALSRVHSGAKNGAPFVSVVAAARNEEKRIVQCLESLKNQDYPPDRYEVIFADDRSTDDTPRLLRMSGETWKNLRIISIDHVPDGVSPKKNALSAAILKANGEIILQTDADCVAPPEWISGMAGRFEPDVGLVAGVAPYFSSGGWLNSFVRHEYLWNAALSASSIFLGHGTHVSGRNLGFRRAAFMELGGYGEGTRILSGDDTLLLHRLQRSRIARAVTMPGPATHVYTEAPPDIVSFLRQRTRHMSTGRYFEPVHILAGVIVYGFHLGLIIALALSFFSITARSLFVSVFLWKTIADVLVARTVHRTLGLDVEWRRFVLNEFFLMVYMALMPCAGLFIPVKWK